MVEVPGRSDDVLAENSAHAVHHIQHPEERGATLCGTERRAGLSVTTLEDSGLGDRLCPLCVALAESDRYGPARECPECGRDYLDEPQRLADHFERTHLVET